MSKERLFSRATIIGLLREAQGRLDAPCEHVDEGEFLRVVERKCRYGVEVGTTLLFCGVERPFSIGEQRVLLVCYKLQPCGGAGRVKLSPEDYKFNKVM